MFYLKNLIHIFYPNQCTGCGSLLVTDELFLCTFCRHDLPILEITNKTITELTQVFYGRVRVEQVVAFLAYRKKGIAQKLIHELKYKGNQEIGVFIGNWFGKILKEKNIFKSIDYIVPVPLHPTKEKKRGYNQLTKFGECLSDTLNIPYKENILRRISSSKTQTLKQRFERFSNTNTKFLLSDESVLENKHVLLIDDVITTGATLEACCNELLKTKYITISIASMAYTEPY